MAQADEDGHPARVSPFRFEGPLEPDDLIGRAAERTALADYARAGRAVSIAAPRRYGKTSLLRAVGATLAGEGFLVARVDLLGLDGPADFASRFATAWRRATEEDHRLRSALHRTLAGLSGFGVSVAGLGVQVSFRPGQEPGPALQTLLALPSQSAKRALIVLDEFQALHSVWPQGEGVLRAHVQEQLGQVAYVFAGSQPHLLDQAFGRVGRAFYQQVLRLPLGRLPDVELAHAIADRFAATGRDSGTALRPLLALAAGHPQRAMFLAHLLWEHTAAGAAADEASWERTLARMRTWIADEMAAVWGPLTGPEQVALRAVHRHGSATIAAAAHPTVSRASRQTAQRQLLRAGLIEPDAGRAGPAGGTRYRLVDPLLGDWLDRRRREH